jgi:predicted TPR repeat methyltransferase
VTSKARTQRQKLLSNPYEHRRLDVIAARWNAKAKDWDQSLNDSNCHLNEDEAYGRFIDQLEAILRMKRSFCASRGVIDAGCATGLVLGKAISSFAWGVGVDISPKMIEVAQSKQIGHAKFFVGDCFKLSSICPKAGAILSRGVLLSHYGKEQGRELLGSARACLEDQGFILWDFLNAAARRAYQHAPENKAYFESDEICAMATGAGFRVAKVLGEPERRVRILLAECG